MFIFLLLCFVCIEVSIHATAPACLLGKLMWDKIETSLVIWKESCELDFVNKAQTSALHKCRRKSFKQDCHKLSVRTTAVQFNKCLTPDLRPSPCTPVDASRWAVMGNIQRRKSFLLTLWPHDLSSVVASVQFDRWLCVRKVSHVFGLELIPKQEHWLILELKLCLLH